MSPIRSQPQPCGRLLAQAGAACGEPLIQRFAGSAPVDGIAINGGGPEVIQLRLSRQGVPTARGRSMAAVVSGERAACVAAGLLHT